MATRGLFAQDNSMSAAARQPVRGPAGSRSGERASPVPQTYRLKFGEEDERPAKDIEFEAHDSFEALRIAHEEARTRSAELWQDGQKLCSIRRGGNGVWEIDPIE